MRAPWTINERKQKQCPFTRHTNLDHGEIRICKRTHHLIDEYCRAVPYLFDTDILLHGVSTGGRRVQQNCIWETSNLGLFFWTFVFVSVPIDRLDLASTLTIISISRAGLSFPLKQGIHGPVCIYFGRDCRGYRMVIWVRRDLRFGWVSWTWFL